MNKGANFIFTAIKRFIPGIILSVYVLTMIVLIFRLDGTGDAGDSVMHFLFARYAPLHPELYFDHWAKPVFVLLASPFAQFGFKGIKLFNVLVSAASIYFTYASCRELNIKNAAMVMVIMIFAPYNIILTLSGLTEPLFALFLISGVFLILRNKTTAAAILISFLPFVRSEGLMMAGIFALYFVMNKNYKAIFFLLSGHIIYSLAGCLVHHDLLWVFSKIPYNRLSSAYGSGDAGHFVVSLIYVIGVPLYVLFWVGMLAFLVRLLWKKEKIRSVNSILITAGTITFVVAHTLFWVLGIFNSMGLIRVLLSILPLISIIALQGFNLLSEHRFLGKTIRYVLQIIIAGYIVVFPFTDNPAAVHSRDLLPDEGQKCSMEVGKYIQDQNLFMGRVFCSYPFLSLIMNWDYFDRTKHLELKAENTALIAQGDVVIWDDWFARYTSGIALESLENTKGLEKIKIFTAGDDSHPIFVLFLKR